jgi:predicted dehydrogenase
MRVLGWGFLGTARINRALAPPLSASARNRLVAVASRDGEKAEAAARQWGAEHAVTGYEALLADPEIDVVYNSLPNALHAEWTVRACRAGKHVLCEKPLALSLEEVDAIGEAARGAGVVVAEAFMYRHHPQTLELKRLVESGELGALRLLRGAFTFTQARAGDPRLDPRLGGGSLWDVGCYPVSFVRFLAGVEPLEAFGWEETGETGVDVAFSGLLRFPGGVLASVDCGFRAPYRTELEVVGTAATIRLARPFKPGLGESLQIVCGDSVETIAVEDQELYRGEVEDMADAVLEGRPPRVSLAESRGNVATLLALRRAAREGRPVAPGPPRGGGSPAARLGG